MEATPQITSATPTPDCPKCGRRMQLLASRFDGYSYVCYAHSLQNTDTTEPFYLNLYKIVDKKDGKIIYARRTGRKTNLSPADSQESDSNGAEA